MGNPSETLKRLRESRGLSLRDVAAKVNVSISLLSRAENGHLEDTNFGAIKAVCDALGVTVDDLYNSSVEKCPACGGEGWVISKQAEGEVMARFDDKGAHLSKEEWMEVTDKVQALTQRAEQAEALLRKLLADTYAGLKYDNFDNLSCTYCNSDWAARVEDVKHQLDCPIERARQLLKLDPK